MKYDLDNTTLHRGKQLVVAKAMNFGYKETPLWKENLETPCVPIGEFVDSIAGQYPDGASGHSCPAYTQPRPSGIVFGVWATEEF